MIQIFDIEQNFWDLYPDFKIALSFKDLYKQDKSRGREKSSKLMWFVAYTTDLNSKFYNLDQESRFETIGEDYMKDIDFYQNNKKELDVLIEDYVKLNFSSAQKQLRAWEIKSDERAKFISTIPYNLENYEDLDKMAINTSKIYNELKNIKELLSKEDGEGSMKGGGVASLND